MLSPQISPKHSPYSPSKSYSRASSSHAKLKKVISPYDSRSGPMTPEAQRSKRPYVQDSINRVTSPYRKNNTEISQSSKTSFEIVSFAEKFPITITTPNKIRPVSSKKFESFDLSFYHPNELGPTFPDQEMVETNLKDSLVTLKKVMRDCEEKAREKRVLQKVVEQLKVQTEGMKARKVNFSKNFERLHKDRLSMNQSSLSKEKDRVLIQKNSLQAKDAVKMFEKEIQESINQNVEAVAAIEAEQDAILRVKQEIAELKKLIPIATREKEKIRSDLQMSSKMRKTIEEKYVALAREKSTYLYHIGNSNKIKQQ